MPELRQYDELLDHAFYRKRIYVDDDFSFIAKGQFENATVSMFRKSESSRMAR